MSSFLFLAHTHGFLDDISMLRRVLGNYSPRLVYHEQLQHIQDVSSLDKNSNLFQENKELIQLCSSISLKGFDMENFGLSDDLIKKIHNNSFSSEDELLVNSILLEREKFHISLLKNLHESSLVLVLVVVGAWHLRKDGLIRKNFPDEKYILVIDDKGRECLEPSPGARFSE
jgi:hypothetical protein